MYEPEEKTFQFIYRKENLKRIGSITSANVKGNNVHIQIQSFGYWGNKKKESVYDFKKNDIERINIEKYYDLFTITILIVLVIVVVLFFVLGNAATSGSRWSTVTCVIVAILYWIYRKHTKMTIRLQSGMYIEIIAKNASEIDRFREEIQDVKKMLTPSQPTDNWSESEKMICCHCGKEINPTEKFCRFCGEKITSDMETSKEEGLSLEKDATQTDAANTTQEKIRIHHSYYDKEFANIELGLDTKFNWAVFFFGPLLTLYRKMYRFFIKMYLPPLICAGILSLLLAICIYAIYSGSLLNVTVLFVLSAFCLLNVIWSIICSIRGAKQYNLNYYYHLKETMADPTKEKLHKPSFLPPVLFIAGVIGFEVILAVVISAAIYRENSTLEKEYADLYRFESDFSENMPEENTSSTASQSAASEEVSGVKPAVYYLGLTAGEIQQQLETSLMVEQDYLWEGGVVLYCNDSKCPYIFLTIDYQFAQDGTIDVFYDAIITGIITTEGQITEELSADTTLFELQNMFYEDQLDIYINEMDGGWTANVNLEGCEIHFNWPDADENSMPVSSAQNVYLSIGEAFYQEEPYLSDYTATENQLSGHSQTIQLFPADGIESISLSGEDMVLNAEVSEMTVDMDGQGHEGYFSIGRDTPNGMKFLGFVDGANYGLNFYYDPWISEIPNAFNDYGDMENYYIAQIAAFDLDGNGQKEILVTVSDETSEMATGVYQLDLNNPDMPFVYQGVIVGSCEIFFSDGRITAMIGAQGRFNEYYYNSREGVVEIIV